jgi:hypothetical protein
VRGDERGERRGRVLGDCAELVGGRHLLRDVEVKVERLRAAGRVRLGDGRTEERERGLRGLRGWRMAGKDASGDMSTWRARSRYLQDGDLRLDKWLVYPSHTFVLVKLTRVRRKPRNMVKVGGNGI